MASPATPRDRGIFDAPHLTPVTPEEDIRTVVINQISWSAVLAGIVVALSLHIILNLLGIGVGAAVLDPARGNNPSAETFSGAAALWWTLSGILASLIGGYVAGRTSGKPKESTAGFHGLAAWAATTVLIFLMVTSHSAAVIGGIYGTVSGVVEQTAGGAAQGAAQNPNVVEALKGQVEKMTGQNPTTPAPTPEQKQEVTKAAGKAATAVSIGAIFTAVALLVGALAGWVGGRMGAVDPTLTDASLSRERRT
jgi:hypothetical protein